MSGAEPETVSSAKIVPVLLSGGTGARLWPMSRELYPKQLLPLCSDRTMLQDTVLRVGDAARFAPPLVLCSADNRFSVDEQLRQIGVTPGATLLEPVARNTGPACAAAGLHAAATMGADAILLVLPTDHVIRDVAGFLSAVDAAIPAAQAGRIVTFGVAPTAAEAGYGYIRRGAPLEGIPGAFRIDAFIEKPSHDAAQRFVADGFHLWNSGIVLFTPDTLLRELERHDPDVLAACRGALAAARSEGGAISLDPKAFAASPSISLDYAVLEKTEIGCVVPCSMGWTDVRAWSSLWEIGVKDTAGNVCVGDVVLHGAEGCYVRSEDHLTAVVGLTDAVVVVTDNAVLVARKDDVQSIKPVVERLKAAGRPEVMAHRLVHRPWGTYETLGRGDRFQVKTLTIKPGARLSLQRHYHRAEHWVVTKGTALVTRGEDEILLYENQSIDIPIGILHRLENPGKVDLVVIEVQAGSYLGEDDIIRFEDVYGRH